MKYSFNEKELTLLQANRLLAVLWGTTNDDDIHEDNLEDFCRDRIQLYSRLGKPTKISVTVEFE